MANGYFERGEIYWVRMDTGFGFEQGVGRPGVILSCDKQNNSQGAVTVAFCSKQPQKCWEVEIEATGVTSYVKCSQINTVDKTRLGKCIGVLNSAEMKALEDVLEDFFDLGYVDETALKEKESEIAGLNLLVSEARAETATVKAEIGKRDEEIAALKMEIEMWQKCYGRCMDMLVDTKVAADLSRRTAAPKVVEVKPPVEPVEEPKQPEPPKEEPKLAVPEQETRLDINSCTATALKKIGFSLALARKIVESRPFSSVEDLKRINGLKSSHYRIVEPKLCCVPVKVVVEEAPTVEEVPEQPEVTVVGEPKGKKPKVVWDGVKVNINKVETITELMRRTGLCQRTASEIIRHREMFGDYERVEDLMNLQSFGKIAMNRYGHMLEV